MLIHTQQNSQGIGHIWYLKDKPKLVTVIKTGRRTDCSRMLVSNNWRHVHNMYKHIYGFSLANYRTLMKNSYSFEFIKIYRHVL